MKKTFISILTVLVLFLLQTSIFHHLSIKGVVPNLLLIVVCAYGFLRGETDGIIAGFFCGLLMDVFYADIIGLHSLEYMYIGFFNGMLNRFYVEDTVKLPVFCIGLSDVVLSFLTYFLRFVLQGKFNFAYYSLNIILPEFIYTMVVCIVLYPALLFIEHKVIPFTFRKEEQQDVF
ncbi:MAG: rod shape-determining protein MreD [Lachnospiraceae bacterium]|nr:rod shape-determining protein MreD [Lachnospiraceae bacterium]